MGQEAKDAKVAASRIRERLTPAEQELVAAAEVYTGRSLTDQEIALGLQQARALGELPSEPA